MKVTRPGGTISNIGYHGDGEYVDLPRAEWGVGMSDKTICTGLCPGESGRMSRLMRLIQNGRVDPSKMTSHRFGFDEIDSAFEMMQTIEDGMLKPIVEFT